MTDVALSEEIDHAGPCGCARDWYVIGCICPSCVIGETQTHNLNKYPAVSVFESGTNNEIFAEVTYNSLNQCTLTFTDLITGTVTFN